MFEKKCNKSGRFCVVELDDVYHCGEYCLLLIFLKFIISLINSENGLNQAFCFKSIYTKNKKIGKNENTENIS